MAGCSRKLPSAFPAAWRGTRPSLRPQISQPRSGAQRLAHGEHEKRTGEHDVNWPTGTPSTSSTSRPANHCHHKPETASPICGGSSTADEPQLPEAGH